MCEPYVRTRWDVVISYFAGVLTGASVGIVGKAWITIIARLW
jgi:hypothetical protein